jgi:hypothetical protein
VAWQRPAFVVLKSVKVPCGEAHGFKFIPGGALGLGGHQFGAPVRDARAGVAKWLFDQRDALVCNTAQYGRAVIIDSE